MPLHSGILPCKKYPKITIWKDTIVEANLNLEGNSNNHPGLEKHMDSYQLKEASVREANATPPTIGTRVATTNGFGTCLAPAPAQEFHHQPCSSNICTVTTHLQRQRDDDFTILLTY